MQGKVKWFSVEKGFGFIVGDDSTERHFAVRDIEGADLPSNGDVVSFDPQVGKKGPRATKIKVISRSTLSVPTRSDDRVVCPHCKKKMVPRLITNRGSLSKSVCPFCGGLYKSFSACFIATAVYGDIDAPQVAALRRFRDSTLRRTTIGRFCIRMYYKMSPQIANSLSRNSALAKTTKRLLDLLVRFCG